VPGVPHQQQPQYSMDINPEMMVPSSIHPTTPANINRAPGPVYYPVDQPAAQLSSQGQQPNGAQATYQLRQMTDSQYQYMRQPYLNVHQVQTQPVVSQQGSVSFHQGMSTDIHVIIDYCITNCVLTGSKIDN